MSERLVTKLNGNGKSDNAETLLIIVVAAVAIAIIWFFYKTSTMCCSQPPQQPIKTTAAPLRAVVSPAPPVVRAVVSPAAPKSDNTSDEQVKVVKVKGDSADPYETVQLSQDTIENPDFLMQIGKDPMTEVRNKVKNIDDIQYSTPQDLLGIDAVLQADAQVKA